MKRILLLAGSQFATFSISAQLVNFDNYVSATNNNVVNHFSGSYNLSQATNKGIITGGAVKTTNLEEGPAIYRTFQISTSHITASVCFKYSSSLDQGGSSAAELRFFDPITLEHLYACANGEPIQLATGGRFFTSYIVNGGKRDDDHRYKLELTFSGVGPNPDTLDASIFLYDLGPYRERFLR